MLNRIFKRVFCKHDWVYQRRITKTIHEDDFCGDGCYNTYTVVYEVYRCRKCGKERKRLK